MGPSGGGGASQIVYRDTPAQPTREDPSIEQARQAELRRQQQQRGRASTLVVAKPSSGPDLLPSGPGGGASMLGPG